MDFDPSAEMRLATAIADRDNREIVAYYAYLDSLGGGRRSQGSGSSSATEEIVRQGMITLLLERLSSDEKPIGVDDLVRQFSNDVLDQLLPFDSVGVEASSLEQWRGVARQLLGQELHHVGGNLSRLHQNLVVARGVARDNQVPVALVFEDDGLYAEMTRRSYGSPTLFVHTELRRLIDGEEALVNYLLYVRVKTAVIMEAEDIFDIERIDEDTELEMERARADTGFMEDIYKDVALKMTVDRGWAAERLKQLWGNEAVDQLSPSERYLLLGRW